VINGYLDALGKPRIAAVKRDAEIAEAEAVRDARIQKAHAAEAGQKAELLRDTNIAEAEKDKEMKVASFKRDQDTAKAEADQAYSIQEARAKQSVVEEQMKVELVRKEREIDLEAKEILRREKQYDANKAKLLREADALQYRIEAEAKGQAAQKRLDGLAVAEAEKAKGSAEAEVIRLRGLAEAEAKEKLAEAFEKFGEAAILDIIVKMLPELAGKVAAPISNIDKLTVVDTGNGEGAARLSNYVTSLMSTAPEMLKSVSGLDVNSLIQGLTSRAVAAPRATVSEPAPVRPAAAPKLPDELA
jgi:flotillin